MTVLYTENEDRIEVSTTRLSDATDRHCFGLSCPMNGLKHGMHSYVRARQVKHVQCEACVNCRCLAYSLKREESAKKDVLVNADIWNSLWRTYLPYRAQTMTDRPQLPGII